MDGQAAPADSDSSDTPQINLAGEDRVEVIHSADSDSSDAASGVTSRTLHPPDSGDAGFGL